MANPLKSAATGASVGAALGTVVPGVGNVVGGLSGAALGFNVGMFQMLAAGKSKDKADNLQPTLYDPTSLALLDEINQRRAAIQTGSAFSAGTAAINTAQAGTQQAIVAASGGDAGGTISGLLAAQQGAGQSINQLLAQDMSAQQFNTTLYADLQRQSAARAMELSLAYSAQNRAEWAQGKQNGFANMQAATALIDPAGINLLDILQRNKGTVESLPPENVDVMPGMQTQIPQLGVPLDMMSILPSVTG
jgi:hypothetical protein